MGRLQAPVLAERARSGEMLRFGAARVLILD